MYNDSLFLFRGFNILFLKLFPRIIFPQSFWKLLKYILQNEKDYQKNTENDSTVGKEGICKALLILQKKSVTNLIRRVSTLKTRQLKKKEREERLGVITEVPGKKAMMDASVFGRSSKSEATCAEP